MELKLYLNKFLKVDNIEMYALESLYELRETYTKFIDNFGGKDPDFPMMNFGDPENTYKSTNNVTKLDLNKDSGEENSDNSSNDLFKL
jgi:hypothetical protein